MRDKKKIWSRYVVTEEKTERYWCCNKKKFRRNLLRLLAVRSGVSSFSATSVTGLRCDGAGYTARVFILQN